MRIQVYLYLLNGLINTFNILSCYSIYISNMPYGASPREFTVTVLAAFFSAAVGSSLVHAIMKPNEAPMDFSEEVEERSKAIREMQGKLN